MRRREAAYVAHSVVGGIAARGAGMVSGFVLTGVLVARLGEGGYGLWVILTSVVSFAAVLDGGVLAGMSRHVAVLQGGGRTDEIDRAVTAGLFMYVIVGGIAMTVAWFAAPALVGLLRLPQGISASTAQVGVLLAAATWAAGNVWMAIAAAAEGADRMPAANVLRAAIQALVTGGIVVAALLRGTVTSVLAGGLVVTILAVPVAWVLLRRWTGIGLQVGRDVIPWMRAEVSYGLRLQVSQLSFLSRDLVDRLVLGVAVGVASVAGYHVAYRVASLTAALPGIFLATAIPLAARRYGEGTEWTNDEVDRHGRRLMALTSVVVGATAAGYEGMTRAWVGDAAAGTYVVFVLVALAFFASNTTGVLTAVLRARGTLAPELTGAVTAAVANVPLTIWLATVFGVTGVVAASALATLLGNALYLLRVTGQHAEHVRNQLVVTSKALAVLLPLIVVVRGAAGTVPQGRAAGLVVGSFHAIGGLSIAVIALRAVGVIVSEDVEAVRDRIRKARSSSAKET